MTVTARGNGQVLSAPGQTPDVILAEKAILGAMLGGNASAVIDGRRAAEAIIEILPAEDFFADTMHQAVYGAVRYLAEEGEALTPQAVLARLVATERGQWQTGQAGVILADLMHHATPSYEADARRVLRAAVRRRGLLALTRASQMLAERSDFDFDPAETADDIRALIDEAFAVDTGTEPASVADLFIPALDRIESGRPPGVIQFPWEDLRDVVPWLRPGQLVTIAARPSLGKSLLGLGVARYVAIHQKIAAILFTMEQDRDEVMDRLISAEAGIPLGHITTPAMESADWDAIAGVTDKFADGKLIIDDMPRVTLSHIRARLRGMARREPAQVAIIDYLQLMDGAAGENRQREVSALVGGLKAIAREFRIPVIMLCQLNRGPESRHDKRPYLSDARESGAVENDSDVAILIHRPDHYEPESPRAGEADLIVDKNRNGPRATVTVGFHGHYARFVNLAWSPSRMAES